MGFGLGIRRWEDTFEDDELAAVREFAARVDPSRDWQALLGGRPSVGGFNLWSDFGHYWDTLLTQYGLIAPYDAAHLLPIDFGAADPKAPRCVNLRPAARWAWFVVDAGWVANSWRGLADKAYARRCRADAGRFDDWMASIGPGAVEEAIEELEARRDAFDIVSAHLELRLLDAARVSCATRCPVTFSW